MRIMYPQKKNYLGGRAFSQPEGLFEWDIDAFVNNWNHKGGENNKFKWWAQILNLLHRENDKLSKSPHFLKNGLPYGAVVLNVQKN